MHSPNTRVVATDSAAPTLASLLPLGLGVVAGASVVLPATWFSPACKLAFVVVDVAAVGAAVVVDVVVVVVVVVVIGVSVVVVVVAGAAVVVAASVLVTAVDVVVDTVVVSGVSPSTTPFDAVAFTFTSSSWANTTAEWSVESAHTSRRIADLRDALIVDQEKAGA